MNHEERIRCSDIVLKYRYTTADTDNLMVRPLMKAVAKFFDYNKCKIHRYLIVDVSSVLKNRFFVLENPIGPSYVLVDKNGIDKLNKYWPEFETIKVDISPLTIIAAKLHKEFKIGSCCTFVGDDAVVLSQDRINSIRSKNCHYTH